MRRPLLYLALVATLAALTGTSRLAANTGFVADGVAGALLYAADFALPDASMALSRRGNSARLQDGELVLEPGEPNRLVYAAAGPELADFELEVETLALDGPPDNGFGVLFRLQQPRSFPLAEAFGLPAFGGATGISYYLFLASSDGYYQLLRTLFGRQQVLSTWIPSPYIRQGIGVSNRLKIRAKGPELEFFINDRQLEFCIPDHPSDSSTWVAGECLGGRMRSTVRDEVLLEGRIAVAAQSMHEAGILLAFDNLLLRMPAEGAVAA